MPVARETGLHPIEEFVVTDSMLAAASSAARLKAFMREDEQPATGVRELTARAYWLPGGALAIHYQLDADLHRLRIPQPAADDAADELWRHTCFEAFIAVPGAQDYREFNFSPSGQWAVYAFDAWRERDIAFVVATAPRLRIERAAHELVLVATLPAALLPARSDAGSVRIGLCAVLEHADGALEYWALHHPVAQPDFHHRDGFVLELAQASAENIHD